MNRCIKLKAKNCEGCVTKPCQVGCPLNNDITSFINLIKSGKIDEAYYSLSNTTVLPSICGRICPHEKQCEGSCVKGVSYKSVDIGILESYVGDYALKNNLTFKNSKKLPYSVAIVGGGPAGLTCASFLKRNGVKVTIYEKHDYLGGLLVHGIPEFRLSKKLVKKVTDNIINEDIEVKYNVELSKDISLEDLEKNYDAVFLGIGANKSLKMNIEGENLNGVYYANEFLENKMKIDAKNKTVLVIGGGNTSIDIARTVKKMGAKNVTIVYRRKEENMKADKKEVLDAKKDKIEFLFQTNILRIIGNDKVDKVELIKSEVIDNAVCNLENSNYFVNCDYVFISIGSTTDNLVTSLNLDLDSKSKILTHNEVYTSREKVFAGGDVTSGKQTVAFASRQGRDAAYKIIEFLNKNMLKKL